jgi:hypothetical protein
MSRYDIQEEDAQEILAELRDTGGLQLLADPRLVHEFKRLSGEKAPDQLR